MSEPRNTTAVNVSRETQERLRRIADVSGSTVTSLAEEACSRYLDEFEEQHKDMLKKLAEHDAIARQLREAIVASRKTRAKL